MRGTSLSARCPRANAVSPQAQDCYTHLGLAEHGPSPHSSSSFLTCVVPNKHPSPCVNNPHTHTHALVHSPVCAHTCTLPPVHPTHMKALVGLADHAREEGLFGELPCPSVSRDSPRCPQRPLPAPCSALRAAGGKSRWGVDAAPKGSQASQCPLAHLH